MFMLGVSAPITPDLFSFPIIFPLNFIAFLSQSTFSKSLSSTKFGISSGKVNLLSTVSFVEQPATQKNILRKIKTIDFSFKKPLLFCHYNVNYIKNFNILVKLFCQLL